MTAGDLEAGEWVERLAGALARLHMVQTRYEEEYVGCRPQVTRCEKLDPSLFGPRDRLGGLDRLYFAALQSSADDHGKHFRELRTALETVRCVLGKHPAWAGYVDPANGGGKVWTQIAARGELGTLWKVVGGLMARATEVSEDGFRVAASELETLLAPERKGEPAPVQGDLTVGYHAALFEGLRVDDEIRVTNEVKIVPFAHLAEFVNDSALQGVVPEKLRSSRRKSVGAIVKPFRWKPEFRARGEDREQGEDRKSESDRIGSFFEDAEALIELVAVWHGVPIVRLETIPYCIHRTTYCLLGAEQSNGGYTLGRPAGSLGRFAKPSALNSEAFDEARKTFLSRDSVHYRVYAPVISRLAEALARSGQFAVEDRILDVAIALERMYELDQGSISRKLRNRASRFLGSDAGNRRRDWESVKEFYEVRSDIVHNRLDILSAQRTREASSRGIDVARRSLFKLLREGPPDDWDALAAEGS